MKQTNYQRSRRLTLDIAVIAIFSALLSGGKLALSAIPNVEIVTLLIVTFSISWGMRYAIPAVFVFVIIESLLWGFNTWVISYIIHWNMLAVVFVLLKPLLNKLKPILAMLTATLFAVIMTALFGVLTSFIDTLIAFSTQGFVIATNNFWYRFAVLYARGAIFFIVHIVSNAIMVSIGFIPLTRLLTSLRHKMYDNHCDIPDSK